jgi:S1-C subfamily serine protease
MTGGEHPGDDQQAPEDGRVWRHPSEVGLATRGRVDRKRSALLASGVLIGGLGLLISGVLLGATDGPATASTSTVPLDRAELSVAQVMTDSESSSTATAVVLDDRGHLLVDASAVEDTTTVWVRCSGSPAVPAEVLARDDAADLAVLRMDEPDGVPASVGAGLPRPGAGLVVVRAGEPAVSGTQMAAEEPATSPLHDAIRLVTTSDRGEFPARLKGSATDDLGGGVVFDLAGQLVGLVTADHGDGTVRVLAAGQAIDVAQQLLDG